MVFADHVVDDGQVEFEVELESVGKPAPAESLMGCDVRGGEECGVWREGEGVAVPVDGEEGLGEAVPERVVHGGRMEADFEEADLLGVVAMDAGAECCGHELCAQAHAEHGDAALVGLEDERPFGEQERVGVGVVGADVAAAECESAVGFERGRDRVATPCMDDVAGDADVGKRAREEAGSVFRAVLEEEYGLHQGFIHSGGAGGDNPCF